MMFFLSCFRYVHSAVFFRSIHFTRNADFYRCNFGASEEKNEESCRTFWVWWRVLFFVSFFRSIVICFIYTQTYSFVQFPKRQSNLLTIHRVFFVFFLCFVSRVLFSFFFVHFNLFLHFIRALVHWDFNLNLLTQPNNL